MKRRTFIAGFAALTAGERVMALSLDGRAQFDAALAAEEQGFGSPVERLFREWLAAIAAEDAIYITAPDDEAAQDRAWEARWDVEKRLMAEPGHTARDWLLKMTAWSRFGEMDPPDAKCQPQLWVEARAMIG